MNRYHFILNTHEYGSIYFDPIIADNEDLAREWFIDNNKKDWGDRLRYAYCYKIEPILQVNHLLELDDLINNN